MCGECGFADAAVRDLHPQASEEGLEQSFNSLDAQREACEAYILSQGGEGWTCRPDRYDDGGWTGGNMERPALRRLLADISQGRIDIVVVYKVDRLTRSPMDFARIVETFDDKAVSFVSVTQAFNTTSSMGRLTLNVLLSFAQFEREVTGERIRDKIAASRAKGIWMGGNIPLGYDLGDRRLDVNETEASTVRALFERYLALQSLPALTRELQSKELRSKRWTSRAGIEHGGKTLSCGAVAHILKNRVYVGDAVHKGKVHSGEHEAVVSRSLFDKVQAQLAANTVKRSTKKARVASSPLAGKLFDSESQPMRVTFSYGRGKRMYRYYVSDTLLPDRPRQSGDNRKGERLSAHRIERLLRSNLAPLCANGDEAGVYEAIRRLTNFDQSLLIELDMAALGSSGQAVDLLLVKARLIDAEAKISGNGLHLSISIHESRQGRVQAPAAVDRAFESKTELALQLRTAHRKLIELNASPLHLEQHGAMTVPNNEWTRRRLQVGLLAPDIQRAIMLGRLLVDETRELLLDGDLPLDWNEQRVLLNGSPTIHMRQHPGQCDPMARS